MSPKKLIVILFGLVASAIIFSALAVLFQAKKPIINKPIEEIPVIINNTNNEVNYIKDADSIKEELATTTDPTLFRGFEDRGILINFKDGNDNYRVTRGNAVAFGPQNTSTDIIGQEIPAHSYGLEVTPFRTVENIIAFLKITDPTEEPMVSKINGLEVVEYRVQGMCEGRAAEVVGITSNYKLSYLDCGKLKGDRNYLIETIKTIQLVK